MRMRKRSFVVDADDADILGYVMEWAAACERIAKVAEVPETLAPEGCSEWLRWLAQTIRERAGISPPQ